MVQDDFIQQAIREPYANGYFQKIGLNVELLKPYLEWKLEHGKMPTFEEVSEIRDYLSELINDRNSNVEDYDKLNIIYIIDDEIDLLYFRLA